MPPDVSFNKQPLRYGWAYVFRHRSLGELGRVVLEETDDGRTRLSFEVVGDPNDPMTAERAAIFQPLGMELARQMEAAFAWLQVAARCFSSVPIVIEDNVIAVIIADNDLALSKSVRPAVDIRTALKDALAIEIVSVHTGNAKP